MAAVFWGLTILCYIIGYAVLCGGGAIRLTDRANVEHISSVFRINATGRYQYVGKVREADETSSDG